MSSRSAHRSALLALAGAVVASGCLTDFPALRSSDAQTGGASGSPGDAATPDADADCDASAAATLAFPTAEGFGALSKGGRGGKVLRVTNLNDDGSGSLRAAMNQTGPRTIVFDVSGTIELASRITLTAAHSYVTVAGQTSPAGIQLRGGGLLLSSGFHDGIVRHLRVRPGGSASGAAIAVMGDGAPVHDVIVDHCDLMWSTGDLIRTGSAVTNVTLQWNLVAEALEPGGVAFSGTAWDTSAGGTLTIHHNLLTRSGAGSKLSGQQVFDFRNNLIFNWGTNNAAVFGSKASNLSAFGNFVANVYLQGSTSLSNSFYLANGSGLPSPDRGGTKIFTEGNWGPLCSAGCDNDWDNGYSTNDSGSYLEATEAEFRATNAFTAPAVKTDQAKDVRSVVSSGAGATPWKRDAESQRVIDDVTNLVSHPFRSDEGGPWPQLTGGLAAKDTDADGMPDAWESAHGLDPLTPSDGAAQACNGWTNLENYLDELAAP